jgi:ABC-2 type transport system ATP-binding protein
MEGAHYMATLKVEGLTKDYGEQKGIFDFNLNMNKKDIVLLLGPNGAGKTTAIRGILGLTSINAGSVTYDGVKTNEQPTEFLKSVGAMVSAPAYYEYMTGFENLKLYGRFYAHVDETRILEVLKLVDLTRAKDKKVEAYSTGMKQRLDFARAILHQPRLLILDEPFNGMDIEQKAILKEYLNDRGQDNDQMTIVSSHTIGDFIDIANRVVILYDGKCLFEGSIEGIKARGISLEEHYLATIKAYRSEVSYGTGQSRT